MKKNFPILVIIALILYPLATKAESSRRKIYSKAISFPLYRGFGISGRMLVSENIMLTGSVRFNYDERKDTDEEMRYNFSEDIYKPVTRHRETGRASTGIYFGFRKYLKKDIYSYFAQPEIGLLCEFEKYNYYYSDDEDKTRNKEKALTFGAGLRFLFGLEHFITERISWEGVIGFSGSYIDFDIEEKSKRKRIDVDEVVSVAVTYYW